MTDPHQKLQRGEMPKVEYSSRRVGLPNGTTITVYGYNGNAQGGLATTR